MKKVIRNIIKTILAAVCLVIGIVLLYEILVSFKFSDPWGLGFTFYILPTGIISIGCLTIATILIKEIIKEKNNK